MYPGIIGPIIYTIVLFTLGVLEPGYNPILQSMSELGDIDAPYAIIMNTLGFPLLGIFFMLFAIGVQQNISSGVGTKIGPLLIAISGLFLILTGIFPCDPDCIDVTVTGGLHSFFATLAAILMIPVPLAIVPRVYSDQGWHRYIWLCWIVVIISGFFSMLYMFPEFAAYTGLLQRLAMAPPLVWMVITAIKILGVVE